MAACSRQMNNGASPYTVALHRKSCVAYVML